MSQQSNPQKISFSGFDHIAEEYDSDFSCSPVGQLQRQRVHHFLGQELGRTSLRVLEINCGTGEDAIWLAERGHHVIATDSSAEMINITMQKIKGRYFEGVVQARQISFNELNDVFMPQSFDLVFSDFGGLNCIPENVMRTLLQDIYALLKPGGKFIAVIMGRKCLWERGYYLLKGNGKEAFRRSSKQSVAVSLGSNPQPTWYFAPSEIINLSAEYFYCRNLKPVGIAVPPSYLNPFFAKKKWLLSTLNTLEAVFSFSVCSNYADHFYISLQKKN